MGEPLHRMTPEEAEILHQQIQDSLAAGCVWRSFRLEDGRIGKRLVDPDEPIKPDELHDESNAHPS